LLLHGKERIVFERSVELGLLDSNNTLGQQAGRDRRTPQRAE
jgi:hypothetical protein